MSRLLRRCSFGRNGMVVGERYVFENGDMIEITLTNLDAGYLRTYRIAPPGA